MIKTISQILKTGGN